VAEFVWPTKPTATLRCTHFLLGKGGVTAYLGEVMACSIELEIDAGPSPGEFITRVVNSPSGGEPKAVVQLDAEVP